MGGMKVGIVGTIWENTPPSHYGGTEEVVANLCNGLVDTGHDVTLFGPATTTTSAHLSPTVSAPLRQKNIPWENIGYPIYHMTQAFERAEEFDILHVHLNKMQDYFMLPLAYNSPTPVVFTLHFKIPTPSYHADRYAVLEKYRQLPFTSISQSQHTNSDLNVVQTVYNSINLNEYPFSANTDDYFLWINKILPYKGTKEAILAAKKAGVKLILAGPVEEGVAAYKEYFEKEVKPLIDGTQITYVGPITQPEKAKLYGRAKALLNPILWEEPFGLVMAESQACGTPVIAFNNGSAPEVIENGKTGFLVDTVDDMADNIQKIDILNRQDCRQFAQDHFSIDQMTKGYEEAYQTVISNWDEYIQKEKEVLKEYRDKAVEIG